MRRTFIWLLVFGFFCILADSSEWYIVENPVDRIPEAVWSAKGDGDSSYEIRYSYLNGTEWAPSVALTDDSVDDSDPRLAFDSSGNRNVVWWTDDTYDLIKYSYKAYSGSSWSTPATISDSSDNCQHPSIVVHGGDVWISYERVESSGDRVVLCGIRDDPDPWPADVIEITDRQDELESNIHSAHGHLWVDWIDSSSYLGYSEYVNGSWESASFESYSGESDIEPGRQRIRQKIIE